jgi:type IV pilus assembly protein PilM
MPDFLSTLKNMFAKGAAKGGASAVGIDIGTSSMKVVQLKKKGGKAVLETYGELSLGPYAGLEAGRPAALDGEKLAKALTDLLRESNITTADAGLSIPIGSSLITFLKLPKAVERQLAQVIPLEARKYIPVPISEVSLDWWVVPKEERSYSQFETGAPGTEAADDLITVMLVVIHNDAIIKNQELAKAANVSGNMLEIELFSTVRAALESSLEPQAILDMGASTTKLYIVERGILRSSHIINRGSHEVTQSLSRSMNISIAEAEKIKREQGLAAGGNINVPQITSITIDYIFSEASRVLLNFERKNGAGIKRIALAGGGVLLKGLEEKAKAVFQTEVFRADPFARVEYPAFLADVLKEAGPEFTVAVGIALRKLQDLG